MQIPPTAILQPIARTIFSMVFPASTGRATNRKKRSIYRVLWERENVETSFHCIVFHNSTLFIAFVISVNVNCCEFFCHPYSENHAIEIEITLFGSISISRFVAKIQRRGIANGSSGLYFFLEIRAISKNCPQFGLGQSQFSTANINVGDGDIERLKNYTRISRQPRHAHRDKSKCALKGKRFNASNDRSLADRESSLSSELQ